MTLCDLNHTYYLSLGACNLPFYIAYPFAFFCHYKSIPHTLDRDTRSTGSPASALNVCHLPSCETKPELAHYKIKHSIQKIYSVPCRHHGLIARLTMLLRYSKKSKDSILIDFDLAKKEGETYSSGYNCKFEERHPDTAPRGEMLKSHDIHSVLYLMEKYAKRKFEKDSVMKMQTEFYQIDEIQSASRECEATLPAGEKEESHPVQQLEK